jgi:RNA polymerase-interacting CarD/CdnL/TRCF family regulator
MNNNGFDPSSIVKVFTSFTSSRLGFEQLPEERKNQCFKIAYFLKHYQELQQAKKKQQLNDEDRELLDSVGTILNEYLDMLKEIKGE